MQIPRSISVLGAIAALCLATHAEAGIRVHDPADVLATRTSRSLGGDLLFRESTGGLVRLITSIDDPAITNHGDGAFHPIQVSEVEHALDAIPSGFRNSIDVDIYLLPYPRATCLRSSADDSAIYLSPSVYDAASEEEEQALLAHEIGHLVHRRFLPDSDQTGWRNYLELRGIAVDPRFSASAAHAFRPHEVFAEDFRVLFGGALAARGPIENAELSEPGGVHGLRSFMLERAGMSDAAAVETTDASHDALALYPNPLPRDARVLFAHSSTATPRFVLFDLSGRRIAAPAASPAATGDWQVELGSLQLAAGAYWLDDQNDSAPPVSIRVLR